jgi:hypothetical protein
LTTVETRLDRHCRWNNRARGINHQGVVTGVRTGCSLRYIRVVRIVETVVFVGEGASIRFDLTR